MYLQGDEYAKYQQIYPDVYYKVQPFAMMACDELDACNCGMPTYEMVRQISDQIYEDVLRMHPDLAEEDYYFDMPQEAVDAYHTASSTVEAERWYGRPRRRRRGGFFRDLIDIILLNELFRRRRFY